jgi:histidine triad (HIT) family protein
MDCIFCKIINKQIPASIVSEDLELLSFLDIMPANKGHLLIIPKKHYSTFDEAPVELLTSMLKLAKKLSKAQSLSEGSSGYNILLNNGTSAGQVVQHLHIHLIPRFDHDGVKLNWQPKKYLDKEKEQLVARFKKFI